MIVFRGAPSAAATLCLFRVALEAWRPWLWLLLRCPWLEGPGMLPPSPPPPLCVHYSDFVHERTCVPVPETE